MPQVKIILNDIDPKKFFRKDRYLEAGLAVGVDNREERLSYWSSKSFKSCSNTPPQSYTGKRLLTPYVLVGLRELRDISI